MPIDLLLANGTVLAVSALLLAAAGRARRLSQRTGLALAIIATAILLLHALWLSDNLLLARLFPVADVMAWANLQTPAAALLAGLAYRLMPGPHWQRALAAAALLAIGIYRMAAPYLGPSPRLGPSHWADGVCRQSTISTCSAAAAATLLAAHAIPATEAEMSNLCLTRADGTTMLGLYRGLTLKTAHTPWAVRVVRFPAILDAGPLPAIITISDPGLPHGLLGVGNRHSVVILAATPDGKVQIADPYSGGIQWWGRRAIQTVPPGDALALVRRN